MAQKTIKQLERSRAYYIKKSKSFDDFLSENRTTFEEFDTICKMQAKIWIKIEKIDEQIKERGGE